MFEAYERDVIGDGLTNFMSLSRKIGGEVWEMAKQAQAAFSAQQTFLGVAARCRQPSNNQQLESLLSPTSEAIVAVQNFREQRRPSPFFNHLSAVSESIPALGWVAVAPAPAPFIKEMNDAGQFYGNRVLKDWKDKDASHVEWVKAWSQTLVLLQAYVKQHHTTGLVWNPKGPEVAGGGGVPGVGVGGPPPPPPPPPPPLDLDALTLSDGGQTDHSALFAEINRGEAVTQGLRKVTADMQTHKNPNLRSGPAPYTTPGGEGPKPYVASAAGPAGKTPVFKLDGKKWLVEHHIGAGQLEISDNVQMQQVVYMYQCRDTHLRVKGKLNSIVMDSCRKCSVVFDSLVSSVEFVNCQGVQMQVMGSVPTVSVGNTDGVQIYLSAQSLATEIVTAKSSEMNVVVPRGEDFVEYPIPEQFKTFITPNGIKTEISANIG